MKVIVNSDILYDSRLVTGDVSRRLRAFCQVCADKGHVIVIPETALLEFNRQQSELLPRAISELVQAYDLLDRYNISHSRTDPSEKVKLPDLIGMIEKQKVKVMVEYPILEDYQEAHRRACLHECPQNPAKKTDEMRDLIIWAIALRLAKQEGGALLVSRDEVHINPLGNSEAMAASLVRVGSVEEAEWYLDVDVGEAARLVERILTPVWSDLLSQGLPLPSQVSGLGVSRASFDQGIRGELSVICGIKIKTPDGKTLTAETEIHASQRVITELKLSDLRVNGELWGDGFFVIQPNKVWNYQRDDYEDRLSALMQRLEE
jgi:hypothetical protein